MGSPARYDYCGKKMLGRICEKMATPKSALVGGRFSASGSTTIGKNTSAYDNPCVPIGDCSIIAGNGS